MIGTRDGRGCVRGREPASRPPAIVAGLRASELDAIVKACDPGIRDIVRRMRNAKFETTDSGDGKAKAPFETGDGQLPYPHVAIMSSLERMVEDCGRVQAFLAGADLLDGVSVEASYNPDDGHVVILVSWP